MRGLGLGVYFAMYVKDIVWDEIGAWKHNGSPLKYIAVDKSSGNNNLKTSATKDAGCYILKRIYYQNISSPDLRKIVGTIKIPSHLRHQPKLTPLEISELSLHFQRERE